jgi:hypothetical protein
MTDLCDQYPLQIPSRLGDAPPYRSTRELQFSRDFGGALLLKLLHNDRPALQIGQATQGGMNA